MSTRWLTAPLIIDMGGRGDGSRRVQTITMTRSDMVRRASGYGDSPADRDAGMSQPRGGINVADWTIPPAGPIPRERKARRVNVAASCRDSSRDRRRNRCDADLLIQRRRSPFSAALRTRHYRKCSRDVASNTDSTATHWQYARTCRTFFADKPWLLILPAADR